MNHELREEFAKFLHRELHAYLPEYMFSVEDVLDEINEFFDEEVCEDCRKEKKEAYLGVCGPCYHKRIWG